LVIVLNQQQFEKDFSKASSALSSQLKKLAEQIKKTRKKPPEEQEKVLILSSRLVNRLLCEIFLCV
jgi:hypothetical protein